MKYCFCLMITLFLPFASIAQEIVSVDLKYHRAIARIDTSTVTPGSFVLIMFPNLSPCGARVATVEKNKLFLDTNYCPHEDKITNGLKVRSLSSEEDIHSYTLPSANESWYSYWGGGFFSGKYGANAHRENIRSIQLRPQSAGFPLYFDLFGFYWPFNNHRSMVGFIFNSATEVYADGEDSATYTQTLYALSAYHFFGANIGSGIFWRTDIGISQYSSSSTIQGQTTEYESSSGLGIQVAGGYAFPTSSQTERFLIQVVYGHRSYGHSPKNQTLSLSAGVLF